MKLKCNLEDCDFVPCVHRRPHTELQGCRTSGRCETKDVDVCCVEIQEEQPIAQQPEEPTAEQLQPTETPAPVVIEPEPEQKENLHSFCRHIKKWLILIEGLPENCLQLVAGEDALPCGPQCEHYELRKPNLYFSRKLKQMQKEKK